MGGSRFYECSATRERRARIGSKDTRLDVLDSDRGAKDWTKPMSGRLWIERRAHIYPFASRWLLHDCIRRWGRSILTGEGQDTKGENRCEGCGCYAAGLLSEWPARKRPRMVDVEDISIIMSDRNEVPYSAQV